MIAVAMVLLFVVLVALVLGLAVAIRHRQLKAQLVELDNKIEQLEGQLGPNEADYFIECEITFLLRKRYNIKEKMFF